MLAKTKHLTTVVSHILNNVECFRYNYLSNAALRVLNLVLKMDRMIKTV